MAQRKKQQIEEERQAVISQAVAQFFGGVTKQEAQEAFKTLAMCRFSKQKIHE
ncbi:MAG: hypothetical protein KME25_32335 [Symplocastrum torsivum CPER-KK1]|jgi:hypothetical protein|uniref:Uncharacterized protein n=1 Tax=Symplocastrum torsivum CPER-KK1 TaxID=450513 RepID=A0A951UD37_9CYAN|nr:hypothetical protein [Symplocastrum torsivum CPER-KK1]